MPPDGHLALVVEQGVEHVQGFAGGRRDDFGEERAVAVRQVGVDFEAGLGPVMRVEPAGVAAEAGGLKELPVRRGNAAAAKRGGKRFALLLVDQAAERQGISLLADVPVRCPGELAKASDTAGLSHPRQAEIEAVSQQRSQQRAGVGHGLARSQVSEAVGKRRPARDFGQQVGDPDARQHAVEAVSQRFGLGWRGLFDGCNLQHAAAECHIGQQAVPGAGIDRGQPCVEQGAAPLDEAIEIRFNRDRQRAGLLQWSAMRLGDQPLLKGAVLPAPTDPDLACGQPDPQL